MEKIKEIKVLICDKCGKEISTKSAIPYGYFETVSGKRIDLCHSCYTELPACDFCGRVALKDDRLFFDSNIAEGSYLCASCLKKELPNFEVSVSAAKAFLQRHGVE